MTPPPLGSFRIALAAGVALAIAGCSQAPVPTSQLAIFNTQSTLIGVSHWRVLAEDTAKDVVACLDGRKLEGQAACVHDGASLKTRPVHVELADSASPFGRAFHELLTTELVAHGLPIARSAEDAVVVRYRVQVVERDGRVGPESFPGLWTVLAYGPWAMEETARIISWGALADIYGAAVAQGGAEVVITTSVTDGDRLVMRRSDGYYVAAADVGRYRTFGAVADLAPARRVPGAPALRGFDVVGQ